MKVEDSLELTKVLFLSTFESNLIYQSGFRGLPQFLHIPPEAQVILLEQLSPPHLFLHPARPQENKQRYNYEIGITK